MKTKPKFPFRIITHYTHPSDVRICDACKAQTITYATDNYIDMSLRIGTAVYATFSNDPWVKAIKAQAREQLDVSMTSHLCVSCLNTLHITALGDSPSWQQALPLLTERYGEIAIVTFILVNSYEDEGVTYWFLCPVTEEILDVVEVGLRS